MVEGGFTVAAPYFSVIIDEDGLSMLDVDVGIEILDGVGLHAGYDVCHEASSHDVVGVG